MANTYSSNLRLIIQQDGTNQGTWGGYTNTNIASLIEQAITGVGAITVSGSSNYTLTVTNGASDEARNAVLNITGTLTAAINVICPTAAKTYIVKNGTTGGFAITLKTSAGTGISVPNGETTFLYCDGANVVRSLSAISGIPGAFTTLSASGAVSGVGFSNYLASPPAIGGTAAAAGAFTTLSASSTVSGVGFSNYLASPPAIGGTAAAAGSFTTLTYTGTLTGSTGVMDIGSGQLYKDASGNVGIGTSSPTNKLTISGTAATGATTFLSTGTTTNYNVGQFTNTGGSFYFGLDNNAGTAFTGSSAYGGIVGTGNSTSLGLVTNGSVKVTLDASGNLGLGVTPSAWSAFKAVQVYRASVASETANTYFSHNWYWSGTTDTYIASDYATRYSQQSGKHIWFTAPSGTAGNAISFTQAMTLDAGGNLGIGTSSPVANSLSISQYKNLAFSWSTGVNYANIFNQANSASLILASGYQLTGTSNGFASSYSGSWSKSAIEVGGGAIKFYVDPATTVAAGTDVTPTERMRIDSSGNVGIGTNSPTNKLQVVGSVGASSTTNAWGYVFGSGSNASGLWNTAANSGQLVLRDTSGNAVTVDTSSSNMLFGTAALERMRITSAGNVGIGTVSPTYLLQVYGSNSGIGIQTNQANGGTGGGWIDFLTSTGTVQGNIYFNQAGGYMVFGTNTSGSAQAERMRIDSSGNVGIGTSSPSASAILDAQSTTKGVRFPNMTTTQKNAISSPVAGLVIFDTTLSKLCVYTGAAWQTITSV
jgi:hypothetical protein